MLASIGVPANLSTPAPTDLAVAFALVTLVTVLWFWTAVRRSSPALAGKMLVGLLAWMAVQGALAGTGIYQNLTSQPPRLFVLAVLPALLALVMVFATERGRRFADALPLSTLTYIHVVRIPVELVLYGLFLAEEVPQLMTFAGRNPDILAGITAPLVGLWSFTRARLPYQVVLMWHVLALLLLLNIVCWAILSTPFPFQQVGLDRPNVAILKFPFVWLPAVVVPIVLLGHLVAIRQLSQVPRQATA